ncbi:MAG: hypothetical protein M3408_00260 [Actinomycetota bacterium]|nr:hypothetical protein [Actinomycetota bacterium]
MARLRRANLEQRAAERTYGIGEDEPAGNPPKTAPGGYGYRHGKTQTLSQGRLREVATP